MITQTVTVAPILGCLKAAEEYLRTQLTFKTANDTQVEFVKRFASNIADLERLGNEIIDPGFCGANPIAAVRQTGDHDNRLPWRRAAHPENQRTITPF